MRLRIAAPPFLIFFALGGCSVLPRPTPPSRYHDFGPATAYATTPRVSVGLAGVEAPAWLNGDAIWYRFLNRDPTRLRAYAENRWIAPPPGLEAEAVRERLPAAVRPRYRLQLRVERFEQDFFGLTRADVVVRVRAVLLDPGGVVTAERIFALSAPAAPDVGGAADGLSALGERAAQEISAWAAQCTRSGGSTPLSECGGS